jgi:hypothetical protein
LFFKSNNSNLGIDQNMINVAQMATSKYCWVFGSRRILFPGMLDKIYSVLSQGDWDMIILNDQNPSFKVPKTGEYRSAQRVFRELHRNLTGVGFQIFPTETWKSQYIKKYANTEWTIFGITLEFLATRPNPKVYFLSEPCATSSGESNWKPRFFYIWHSLRKTVYNLPSSVYSMEDKEYVLEHSVDFIFVKKFGLLAVRARFTLVDLRLKGTYNVQVFDDFRYDLEHYSGISPTVAYLVAKTPIVVVKAYYRLYDLGRTVLRKFLKGEAPINPTQRRDVLVYW